MEEYKCEKCEKEFETADALSMHNKAKHPENIPKERRSIAYKKIKKWAIFIIIIVLTVWGIVALVPEDNVKELNVDIDKTSFDIPSGGVHWHPRLTIKINDKIIPISLNIGISVGKIVDTQLSGMRMSPLHTHETDGTLHLENNNPSKKPESLTLGYFFYVWDKPFSSTCIFEHCTDKGELKMYVNGIENNEFENYIMRDNDDIVIEYNSK